MTKRRLVTCTVAAILAASCAKGRAKLPERHPVEASVLARILPAPARAELGAAQPLRIDDTARIVVLPESRAGVEPAARELASLIRRASGVDVPIASAPLADRGTNLALSIGGPPLPDEAYELTVAANGLSLRAGSPAGLFYGVQTIRQLLPYWAEYDAVRFEKPRPAVLPALHVIDAPRYPWRGAMLDVARHFFSVDEVKRYVDLLALHKLNRLHLHLADDQGWRIDIRSRPNLTRIGAVSEVGGGPGGYYTQQQYADLVAYAAARFVTIVPEIDMPGHTTAALLSYPELNCNGVAPPPYTGTDVGFSALCVENEATYQFVDEVVGEIAALTPGPYFHTGGDEVKTLSPAQYATFVERVQQIVASHGKQMIGWDEIAAVNLLPTSIVQYWRPKAGPARLAGARHLILSPSDRTYVDMKYDGFTALGLRWAGLVSIRRAYDWDPDALVPAAHPGVVLGIEAPLWAETVANIRDVEFLAFPRLAAIADLAWSPARSHDWEAFRTRLGEQAPRWTALGVNFYRSPEIDWRAMTQ